MSFQTPVYFVDITTRQGQSLEAVIKEAIQLDEVRKSSGYDQEALDAAARAGLENGTFEEMPEEGVEIVEEFLPATGAGRESTDPVDSAVSLKDHLTAKAKSVI